MSTRRQAKALAASGQLSRTFEGRLIQRIRVRYLLHLPPDAAQGATKRWPFILFLHGAGERGQNLAKVASHGPPKLIKTRPDFPFIVASPQCPAGEHWMRDNLLALLDQLIAVHPVDTSRIYVTGLSMGGYAAWDLATACPERFAAVVPICGGGDLLPILLAESRKLRALRSLPIWAFHGAKDDSVPLQESERMVQAMRDIGNKARLTIYPEATHDAWTETYNNPVLFDWLLSQRRRPRR